MFYHYLLTIVVVILNVKNDYLCVFQLMLTIGAVVAVH